MKMAEDKKLKVFFDSTIFDLQIFGGVSRYFTELISRAQSKKLFEPIFRLTISNNEYAKTAKLTVLKSNLHNVKVKGFKRLSWKLNQFVNSFYSKRRFRKGDFDIYHPTYYSKTSVQNAEKLNTVITVYDMIHELYPQLFSDSKQVIELKKELIYKSKAIIAISQNTKQDILKFYPQIDPKKIHVTYLASSINNYDENRVEVPLDNFLLFVGNRDGYKNFMPMLEAILPSLNRHQNVGVLCVGGGSFKENEISCFAQHNLTNRIIQKSLSDNELKWIYKRSIALIFPSEYEGFGIPVIEAFECECPVILPNLSSFPEVGGEGGLFYEKQDLQKINFYIDQLISNEFFKKDIIQKGKIHASKFFWDKMTLETLEVYKSVISDSDKN